MGTDPFSFRRISDSLGGQTFLQTFALCVLSEQNINMLSRKLRSRLQCSSR